MTKKEPTVEPKVENPEAVLNEDGVVVATDEEIEEILKEINIDELAEGDLSPVFPNGKPYLIIANKYIPYEKGLIIVQEAKVKKETEKLEKLKAN